MKKLNELRKDEIIMAVAKGQVKATDGIAEIERRKALRAKSIAEKKAKGKNPIGDETMVKRHDEAIEALRKLSTKKAA